ncbi:hypothetical protein KFL_000210110 [Klebsormidium nitens]|uniref:G protein gamma domain-containing protein n=1 Tax=Klebsormidium nitens TaxID=105231 RepID=A0A1Y1HK34_KLENI|nr:hypothetical protein KFL_000210110 [Klebsormidium nitens]|eukprot:GAQ78925.1 hypothetical protein KFL_000210110 [Klebsormidium nitens]
MSGGWVAEQANRPRVVYEERTTDVRGRARKKAELKKLDAELRNLKDELDHLSQLPPATDACKQLLTHFHTYPDPFLDSFDFESKPNRWVAAPKRGVIKKATMCGCGG